MQAIDFPQTAAKLIALNSAAKLSADRKPHAVFCRSVRAAIDHKKGVCGRRSAAIEPTEKIIFLQRTGKQHSASPPAWDGKKKWANRISFRSPKLKTSGMFAGTIHLRRQFCSAFCAAACKNLAAVGRCHAAAEAVHFRAMTLLGLVGTDSCHGGTPPVNYAQQPLTRPQRVNLGADYSCARIL